MNPTALTASTGAAGPARVAGPGGNEVVAPPADFPAAPSPADARRLSLAILAAIAVVFALS